MCSGGPFEGPPGHFSRFQPVFWKFAPWEATFSRTKAVFWNFEGPTGYFSRFLPVFWNFEAPKGSNAVESTLDTAIVVR